MRTAGIAVRGAIRFPWALRLAGASAILVALGAPQAVAQKTTGGKGPLSLADLIEQVEPCCVRVDVTLANGSAIGSGFVVDDTGWVATNHHVVSGGVSAKVTFADKTEFPVEGVIAYDMRRDLAILKFRPKGKVRALPLAKATPRKGESAVAIGAPVGLSFSATEGIISAIREGAELKTFGQEADGTWLQTSTPISSGNSGGPLLNVQGEVLGANTASLNSTQNINFAISSLDIAELMTTAAKNKVRDLATIEPLKPEPRTPPSKPPRPPVGVPVTPPSGPAVVCKIPVARKFTHRFKVAKEVDAFDKDITLRTDWMPIEYRDSRLTSCGLQVSVNFAESEPPSTVSWEVGTTGPKWVFFGQKNNFQALLDGQTADFGTFQLKSDLVRGGSEERLTATLPIDRFLRMVVAKDVKIRMSTMEFALTPMQMEYLRDLASQMNTGKTADGRYQVDRYAVEEDPTAPASLAKKAAASSTSGQDGGALDVSEKEKRAGAKLRLARLLLARDREAARRNLQDLVDMYPDTKAAAEAKELLKQ